MEAKKRQVIEANLQRIELIAITPNCEQHIARCARVSHKSTGDGTLEGDRKLIRKLVKMQHLSPLEHASATFLISGISRVCLAQLTRHRHLSFVVRSQRYSEITELDLANLVYPLSVEVSEAWADANEAVKAARRAYRALLEAGVPYEDARYFLPQAVPTELALSGNFRAFREFIQKRIVPEAQWEIRNLAHGLALILADHAPSVFLDLVGESA